MAVLKKLRQKLEASLPESEFDHAYFDQLAAASSYTQTTLVHPSAGGNTAATADSDVSAAYDSPAAPESATSGHGIYNQPGVAHDIMAPAPAVAGTDASHQTLDLKQPSTLQPGPQQQFRHVLDARS